MRTLFFALTLVSCFAGSTFANETETAEVSEVVQDVAADEASGGCGCGKGKKG